MGKASCNGQCFLDLDQSRWPVKRLETGTPLDKLDPAQTLVGWENHCSTHDAAKMLAIQRVDLVARLTYAD